MYVGKSLSVPYLAPQFFFTSENIILKSYYKIAVCNLLYYKIVVCLICLGTKV